MANQNAKFASAIVVCLVAGASFAIPRHAANAAECITEPRQDTPQGQHWYYRIERGTNRHCWYLRDEAGKVAQATQADESSPAPRAVARNRNPTPPRSVEDARAELSDPQADAQSDAAAQAQPAAAASMTPEASSPFPDPQQGDSQGDAISSRWPTASEVASPSTTPLVVADASDPAADTQAEPPPAVAPEPTASATLPPAGKASASLQMLLVVVFAALALAGITASIIYRFGRRRRAVRMSASERRAAIRESFDNAPKPPWAEPAIEKTAPHIERTVRKSNAARSAAAPQTGTAKERYDNIEDVLALLMKHAQQSDA